MKKLKVKSLAETYGVSPKTILEELAGQGIELNDPAALIPPDMVELVEDYFTNLYQAKKREKKSPPKTPAIRAIKSISPARSW